MFIKIRCWKWFTVDVRLNSTTGLSRSSSWLLQSHTESLLIGAFIGWYMTCVGFHPHITDLQKPFSCFGVFVYVYTILHISKLVLLFSYRSSPIGGAADNCASLLPASLTETVKFQMFIFFFFFVNFMVLIKTWNHSWCFLNVHMFCFFLCFLQSGAKCWNKIMLIPEYWIESVLSEAIVCCYPVGSSCPPVSLSTPVLFEDLLRSRFSSETVSQLNPRWCVLFEPPSLLLALAAPSFPWRPNCVPEVLGSICLPCWWTFINLA